MSDDHSASELIRRCRAGEGTRSATPLVWSHAQLVRLAWTIQLGRPVDQQAVVANRYLR